MANAQYERMLEIALGLAILACQEYDVRPIDGAKTKEYLFNLYLEKAKKVLDKEG